jgi:hypothetical protein
MRATGLLFGLAAAYPHPKLPEGNRTQLAMAWTKAGKQLVALGADAQLWHLYERGGNWSDWAPLTSVCPSKNESGRKFRFDGDPAVGVNADGRLEVFVRFVDNLDVWQMYQLDPEDPTRWSAPRESSCVDQDQTTGLWYCLGFEPSAVPPPGLDASTAYWVGTPVFPTSDLTVVNDPHNGALVVFLRGFTGELFSIRQRVPGNSTFYTSPVTEGNAIIEMALPPPATVLV